MYQSESQSVAQYIRKRVAKKLPTKQSLEIIEEIGQALVDLRKQEIAENVENGMHNRAAKHLETMDVVGNLAVASPYAELTTFAVTEIGSSSRKDGLKSQPDAQDDVHALAQIAYQLLIGVRPLTDNGTLMEYQLDGKPIVQQELNRWQCKALKKALTADQSQRTPTIQSFLHELNRVSVKPAIQHIGLALILVSASIGGVFLWTSTDMDRIQPTDRVLENSKVRNKSPNFASFEAVVLPNRVGDASSEVSKSAEFITVDKVALSELNRTKVTTQEKRPIKLGARKKSLLEKFAYVDEVAEAYRNILEIDPASNAAKRGLNQIGDKYAQMVLSVWEAGDKQLSIELTEHCLNSVPEHRRLLALRKELQDGSSKQKPEASTRKIIRRLISEAEEHIKAFRFMLPAGKNAVATYKQVLRLDPQNVIAINGLNAMAVVFENAAREKLASGKAIESAALIEQGLMIRPRHSQLLSLREVALK